MCCEIDWYTHTNTECDTYWIIVEFLPFLDATCQLILYHYNMNLLFFTMTLFRPSSGQVKWEKLKLIIMACEWVSEKERGNLIHHCKRAFCAKTIHSRIFSIIIPITGHGDFHHDDKNLLWNHIYLNYKYCSRMCVWVCGESERHRKAFLHPNEFLRDVFIVVRQLNNFNRFVYSISCNSFVYGVVYAEEWI